MSLAPGTRLGPYEIVSAIGSGGMGEIYKARDTRLDRIVAIKILPDALAADPQFRERFDREARAISQLTHPHICVLHDVGHQDGIDFLVMEYLEGETLEARLKKGGLPLDQALQYAVQIAGALDKAHRAGIVHRDLKAGNIMLVKSGAKLLDFGLAKTAPPGAATAAAAGLSMLPTTPPGLTVQGTILGTFQYMAPEQLEGQEADARTDIFAFGAVLYEMITGRKAFEGKSHASLIAAILEREVSPVSMLQPLAPPALDFVVRKCLAKDPDARWQTARDLASQLEWIGASASQVVAAPNVVPQSRAHRREYAGWASAVLAATVAIGFAVLYFGQTVQPPAAIKFEFSAPTDSLFQAISSQAVSPDGRRVAVVWTSRGQTVLAVRSLDTPQTQTLPGTEGGFHPFWSPDSRYVAFFAQGKLKKIDVTGGPPQTLSDAAGSVATISGGAWGADGTIVFAPGGNSGLSRVAAAGGVATPLTTLDSTSKEQWHRWPSFLPDGRRFLYVAGPPTTVYVGSLDSNDRVRIVATGSQAVYSKGHLLFNRQGTLLAQAFDVSRLKTTGDSFPVAQDVGLYSEGTFSKFSASDTGVLAYRSGPGGLVRQLTWFDRAGKETGVVGQAGDYRGIDLSADGRFIAMHNHVDAGGDIWVIDTLRGTNSRLTLDVSRHYAQPVWSPDGYHITYSSAGGDKPGIFQKVSSGAGQDEPLADLNGPNEGPTDWSHDGRFILYSKVDAKTQRDTWALPLFDDRKLFPVLKAEANEDHTSFSADGRWIVYQSDESGRFEIFVQPFPLAGGKWQISTGGGVQPRWRQDGKELYYIAADGKLMAVDVGADGATFKAGVPKPLFDSRIGAFGTPYVSYAVARDGQRFLVAARVRDAEAPITVVVNWTAALKK